MKSTETPQKNMTSKFTGKYISKLFHKCEKQQCYLKKTRTNFNI